jgi:hypothetical protein
MNILDQLSNNKGTVSSALSKELAQKVLQENEKEILMECIDLATYQVSSPSSRHIRSAAAKVVEIVAEKRPEWVAPHLDKLLPALSVREPQTRWATIRTMGFCARLNKPVAQAAIPFAEKYIDAKEGLCIASSADLFLADLGAISPEDAQIIFPLLQLSMDNLVENEQDWLLEAFSKIFQNLEQAGQAEILQFAGRWQYSSRKSTQQRARRILEFR